MEELCPECLGYADEVYEHVLGEDKYTFIEGVKDPHSVTVLIKGPNDHTIAQVGHRKAAKSDRGQSRRWGRGCGREGACMSQDPLLG